MKQSFTLFTLLLGSFTVFAQAGNDTGPDIGSPVLAWQFDAPDELGIPKSTKFEVGPRPPIYPNFTKTNQAFRFGGPASAITVREVDAVDRNFRFHNGDSITLEAWVNVQEVREGSYAYILGKGRNGKKGFPEKNQNYALRLFGTKGEARVSFLFGSEAAKGTAGEWHRWTTNKGFASSGWHHVAVVYTFGKPNSIRGYIDGEKATGTWDMGGATTRAPADDGDDLTLGTGNGGGAANSLKGLVDDVRIWRTAVPDSVLSTRYEFVPPPPVVKKSDLIAGMVQVQLCEQGLPSRNAWPELPPSATETYFEVAFGFSEYPHKYIDTGVRADRANPLLFRAAANVAIPPGKHRLLLRARGASRLYIDDKLTATTPFPSTDSSGHGTVADLKSYLNLGPAFRFAPPGNRETWLHFDSKGGDHLVVLETIAGGFLGNDRRRPELGETVVAIAPEGSNNWQLLTPTRKTFPYTDDGWTTYTAERSSKFDQMNAAARAKLREQSSKYWTRRREAATDWLKTTPEVPVPKLPAGFPAHNPVDHFLAEKIARARTANAAAAKGTVDFGRDVRPLLEKTCLECHAGSKSSGRLRLDELSFALKGGKSAGPAIVPGKPETSSILARVRSDDEADVMPPKGPRLTKEQVQVLETWIREGAHWPEFPNENTNLTLLADDLVFLRRATLDTVGLVPTLPEIRAFLAEPAKTRRASAIDRLLADPRWADHQMGYWLDVLAENPNIINPTLNNSGPFRWWLYESFQDNKPLDLMVTELIRMKGSQRYGGPAGFAVASQNDVPMAEKGTIVASAFLGVQMKCARCHDAPAHRSLQKDLFQLGAMLNEKPLLVPATSSVPIDKIHSGDRKPLIAVTLKPGATVEPAWPFADLLPETVGRELAERAEDSRDRLAASITAPANERFARVMANRIWQRLMGRGIVENVDDWERSQPTHPELLRWLGRELVRSGYDQKYLCRLILNSHAYQRATDPALAATSPLYASPAPRRLSAEQIVDSLFAATGKPMKLEEVSLDIDSRRAQSASITLGHPRRSWMLTSTSNERDRPSLALPRIQMMTDVLTAFGWRGARQDPTSIRDLAPNALQPAILSNGPVGTWLTRLSDDHGITQLALDVRSVDDLLDDLFLRLLTRLPTKEERATYQAYLAKDFSNRVLNVEIARPRHVPVPYVSWSNHLSTEANLVRQQQEQDARAGDPPTNRLDADWRGRLEDVLWALVNSAECVFSP